ncbi:MAG TPA: hypothetical protein VD695_08715 [Gaiellaceae bacterium]|nr:hypothetical protein [Gaiellaceae bacterium]
MKLLPLLAVGLAVLAGCSSGDDRDTTPASDTAIPEDATLEACAAVADDDEARACYAAALSAIMRAAPDASTGLEEIAVAAYTDPSGRLLGDCHGLMHTVGREYAAEHSVTLESLMTYLPQTNEPGCSAGFAHGLVTGVAPDIDLSQPSDAAAVCYQIPTRYQRYSCIHGFGHAFMRLVREDLQQALGLCAVLGVDAPDCSQGAFHDYWFAVIGADDTEAPERVVSDPRELCGAQADQFVRPCWYRAFIDDRPDEPVESASDILALCEGLDGLQRQACITAASVVGPPDPSVQLSICSELGGQEAVSCIRGTKVQNLLTAPLEDLVALIRGCDGFPDDTRVACYRWLGKVLAVMTNGEFESFGCPAVPDTRARAACIEGAQSYEEPLVTFS